MKPERKYYIQDVQKDLFGRCGHCISVVITRKGETTIAVGEAYGIDAHFAGNPVKGSTKPIFNPYRVDARIKYANRRLSPAAIII